MEVQNSKGATMVEYVLIVALISVSMLVSLGTLGVAASGTFSTAGEAMDNAGN